MDNYPPGTWAYDPIAPWNQPEQDDVQCHECEYGAECGRRVICTLTAESMDARETCDVGRKKYGQH